MQVAPRQSQIVVTGASGFVGANLCRHFLAQGREVIALTGRTRSAWRLPASDPKLTTTQLDLTSEMAVRDFVHATQPRAWINCAAYGAYPSQTDSPLIYRTNFDAVRVMIDALSQVKGFEAFIQMGSQSEYGFNCKAPTEDTAPLPDSDYAASKVAATAYAQFYGKKHGFPAWVFRLYSVYGPYEEISRLIPTLLLQIRNGKWPQLAHPRISRDFVHVEDVCRAVDAVLANAARLPRGELYNIGTGTRTTLEDLVTLARELFDVKAKPAWGSMANRAWDHADWYSNPAKAKRELDWSATISLREGLSKTMAWIQANPEAIRSAEQQSVVQ